MRKKSAWILSFVFACLILVPTVSADEGDIGEPHGSMQEIEQQK